MRHSEARGDVAAGHWRTLGEVEPLEVLGAVEAAAGRQEAKGVEVAAAGGLGVQGAGAVGGESPAVTHAGVEAAGWMEGLGGEEAGVGYEDHGVQGSPVSLVARVRVHQGLNAGPFAEVDSEEW